MDSECLRRRSGENMCT